MTTPSVPLPAGELEPVQAPVEIALVHELLRLFGKAARAHQLYLPNNPIYKQALDNLRAGFRPIWEVTDEVALAFTESEVRYAGEAVLEEGTKSSDSLPWLFYKDGVRELTFVRGFDEEELAKLLDILQRVRKASPDEDDLLTLLWQGDFAYLRYRYVDMSVDPTTPLGDGGERLADSQIDARKLAEEAVAGEEEGEESSSSSGVVNMADFDATLYFLDEKEIEYIQSEVRREYELDLRQNVIALLFDIFEQQADPAIREEVAGILDNFMLHMLSAGQFRNVAYFLRESLVASQRAIDIVPAQRERLSQIPMRLSAPEALAQLLQSMDEAQTLPSQAELLELFEQLRGSALATVFDWQGRLQNPKLRPLLEQAAARLAAQSTAELVKLVSSPSRNVALEAIRRAGGLRTTAAVGPIAKVLETGDAELRAAAVEALAEIGSTTALQALERGVDDDEREVRIAAIRALLAKGHRAVLPRLDAIVKGRAIRDADLSEKMAAFEAYGSLCGNGGVATLDSMLNGKSLFGRREDSELRACAAVALGRVGTPEAQASLRQAANEKDVVVRNAVSRALRGQPS
ncbi:MAG TPA: HEAT repeat domain-containing protein [Gemmatimonadaceae bacterium]|nr:HEAT repeat domain-containing protein [Gemmatimonadaceae bacterium]